MLYEQVAVKPLRRPADNWLTFLSSMALVFIYFAVLVLKVCAP